MKNNYFYIALDIEENGKYYTAVFKQTTGDDITDKIKKYNITAMRIFDTRTQAEYTAARWVACHRANGCYMFDKPFREDGKQ